jgi:hypothetical protein
LKGPFLPLQPIMSEHSLHPNTARLTSREDGFLAPATSSAALSRSGTTALALPTVDPAVASTEVPLFYGEPGEQNHSAASSKASAAHKRKTVGEEISTGRAVRPRCVGSLKKTRPDMGVPASVTKLQDPCSSIVRPRGFTPPPSLSLAGARAAQPASRSQQSMAKASPIPPCHRIYRAVSVSDANALVAAVRNTYMPLLTGKHREAYHDCLAHLTEVLARKVKEASGEHGGA